MSCDVNTRIKEDIYDELMETPLGDFIDMIADLPSDVKIKNFTTEYEQIITTLPKAKELKPQIDKVITIGKKNILSNKKKLFSKLQDKKSVTKVFDELSKRYSSRKGGYSRVLKAGFRTGDDAPMAVIELVDRNTEAKKVDKPKKTETKEKTKEVQAEQKIAKK